MKYSPKFIYIVSTIVDMKEKLKCVRCKRRKTIRNFSKSASGRQFRQCNDCRKYSAEWINNRRETYSDEQKLAEKKRVQQLNARVRREAIDKYGGKCSCCGEGEVMFLAIDHIDGKGRQHRLLIGKWGSGFFHWLKSQGWPSGFRVLCHNCNMAFGMYGYCPHAKASPA